MPRDFATAGVSSSQALLFAPELPQAVATEQVAAIDRRKWILLGCVACLYLPLIFAGPGSDPDSIRELRSGLTLLLQHRYLMSRPPGYFPYEVLCGILCRLGGVVASNFASMLMSLALLDCFLRVCERFEVSHRYLLAATMAIHPVYWAASTSSIDFIWALGCFFLGFRFLIDKRYLGAAALLGLAVGIRLSSVLLAGPLLVWELIERPRDARLWAAGALACAIGAMLYLPQFVAAGGSLRFLTYYRGTWTARDCLGRFIYKNVAFWGLPATVFLIAVSPLIVRALLRPDRRFSRISILAILIIFAFEALFLKLPVQRAYLLPMLPFVLILIGVALRDQRGLLLATAALVFSYNFVNVNLARPDVPDHATRAVFGVFFERGYLLDDFAARRALAHVPLLPSTSDG
jgi:hypothetical protein